jgi:hypothetical protein
LPDLYFIDFIDLDSFKNQSFVWYQDFVAFEGRGDNWAFSVKIYLADELTLQPDMERVILIPFTVPPEGTVLFGGYMDPVISPLQLLGGYYQILFETRFMTDAELAASDHYSYLHEDLKNPEFEFFVAARPELCIFTFIPTDKKVEPKILKGLNPRRALVLHDEPRPPGYE